MMSDIGSMSREHRKNELRRRMISAGDSVKTEEKPLAEETIRKAHRKAVKRHIVIAAVVLAAAAAIVIGVYCYSRFARLENVTEVWERQMEQPAGSFAGYVRFGDNILKYTRDGASYINASGTDVWIQSYEMSAPIVAVNGDYAAIADQQGNDIYICNLDGCLGIARTALPISRVTISSQGMVAAILEGQSASQICYYQRDGSEMDLNIKGILGGDEDNGHRVGYALDVDLSPNGNLLMGSYFYVSGSQLKNRVVFYNFSEVGKNALNRMVGGFDDIYEGSMVARVAFLDGSHAVAFSDNSISFYNLRDEMSPKLAALIPVEEDILSVFYNENYAGVIVSAVNGDNEYRMDVYKNDGEKAFSEEFSFEYTQVEADGDMIFLYNGDQCRIYNRYGVLKYDGSFGTEISRMAKGKLPGQFIVTGPSVMKEIMLH